MLNEWALSLGFKDLFPRYPSRANSNLQPPRTVPPKEPPKNQRYEPLFYQYGVDFVINGHAGVPMRGMVMSCSIFFVDFPVH